MTSLTGIDVSPLGLAQAQRAAVSLRFPVSLLEHSAEQLEFEAEQFDCVVMTFTLCSIPRPEPALAELRRVLKRDGRLLFCEHGLSPNPGVQR